MTILDYLLLLHALAMKRNDSQACYVIRHDEHEGSDSRRPLQSVRNSQMYCFYSACNQISEERKAAGSSVSSDFMFNGVLQGYLLQVNQKEPFSDSCGTPNQLKQEFWKLIHFFQVFQKNIVLNFST